MEKLEKKNLEKKSRKGTGDLTGVGPFRFECALLLISAHLDCGPEFKVIRPRCEPARGWTEPGKGSRATDTECEWTQPGTECFLDAQFGHWAGRERFSMAGAQERS